MSAPTATGTTSAGPAIRPIAPAAAHIGGFLDMQLAFGILAQHGRRLDTDQPLLARLLQHLKRLGSSFFIGIRRDD
jgi:hypothetical protein